MTRNDDLAHARALPTDVLEQVLAERQMRPTVYVGLVQLGDRVRARGEWWVVLGEHHSFGKLRVHHAVDGELTAMLWPQDVEEVRRA